jgi:lipid II isoglutaminyl synthase (glutamine-hydrolysing)
VSTLRLCHLYPGEMNIYADRGNIAVLERRLAWRGLALEVTELGLGDRIEPGRHDLFYLGGGQDRDQAVVADDMVATKAEALHAAVAGGAAVVCVCGGFQLAGHGYTGSDGSRMPGVGILDLDTVAGPTRLIGDLVIEADLDGERHRLVGFENHAGRTRLGPGCRPLGRVVSGHGNNGDDGGEGGVSGRVVGTYLHGPLLPKNPWLADRLIAWGLAHATGAEPDLQPLDDSLEDAAHAVATSRAMRARSR